jgi:hypothetical protein
MTKKDLQAFTKHLADAGRHPERLSLVAGMTVTPLAGGWRDVYCPGCCTSAAVPPLAAVPLDARVEGSDFPLFLHADGGCPLLRVLQAAREGFDSAEVHG